jgi:hypothetical protein
MYSLTAVIRDLTRKSQAPLPLNNNSAGVRERQEANHAAVRQTKSGIHYGCTSMGRSRTREAGVLDEIQAGLRFLSINYLACHSETKKDHLKTINCI